MSRIGSVRPELGTSSDSDMCNAEIHRMMSDLCLLTIAFQSHCGKYVLHVCRPNDTPLSGWLDVQAVISDAKTCWVADLTDTVLHRVKNTLQLTEMTSVIEFLQQSILDKDILLEFDRHSPVVLILGMRSYPLSSGIRLPLREAFYGPGWLLFSMASSHELLVGQATFSKKNVSGNVPVMQPGQVQSLKKHNKTRPAGMSVVNPQSRRRTTARGFTFKCQRHVRI